MDGFEHMRPTVHTGLPSRLSECTVTCTQSAQQFSRLWAVACETPGRMRESRQHNHTRNS